ncbi:MT-a70 family protein [Phlyctema vagabunda]|uniref:MT-a70 family protein n=1 Tax=Phlyctema vagabunda TaxID=108571 RepID=A0ABR4PU45_9HELO
MDSSILYQNGDHSVTLIDIPRSIESAQGYVNARRLVSSQPLEQPYPSVEPKSAKAIASFGEVSVGDLLLSKRLHFALEEIKEAHRGPWYIQRVTENIDSGHGSKRRRLDHLAIPSVHGEEEKMIHLGLAQLTGYKNEHSTALSVTFGTEMTVATLPPLSTFVCGELEDTLGIFMSSAPKFDLIILDPPWPNRSARRKQSYDISYGTPDIRSLLTMLPIKNHLQENGLVAIWVTNKSAFHDMLIEEGGVFDQWGVKLLEEWIWLKVTSNGEPICDIDSTWRKPYEVLLLARQTESSNRPPIQRRVIVGVPDLHSRKPNLKFLLESKIPSEYEALEIFARNLTSRWWAWGNEVLKFQTEEHWRIP